MSILGGLMGAKHQQLAQQQAKVANQLHYDRLCFMAAVRRSPANEAVWHRKKWMPVFPRETTIPHCGRGWIDGQG